MISVTAPVRSADTGSMSLPATPPPPPPARGPEVDRLGVWLTTVDSPVMRDVGAADQARQFLQQEGFSRAALPLQTAGLLTWPALAANNPLGLSLDPALPTVDHSASLLRNLRSTGLRTVGWFEFGLMAPADAPWLNGHDEWLLRRRDGSSTWLEGGRIARVWLNPGAAAVQEGLVALEVDACTRRPLDLIQFDDHLGHPADFGYDRLSLAQWRATPEGAARPDPAPDDPTWRAWRAARITTLLRRIRSAMASRCPTVRLSIAPNPQAFSYRMYLADWLGWVNEGLVDEVVVQLYRDSPAALARELAQPAVHQARRRVAVRIGLLAGLRGQIRTRSSTERDIALVRAQGLTAVDLFFYESARLQRRPTPVTRGGVPGNNREGSPAVGATLMP
ncbi:MAG: family 10 glycosylhydrolase [Cyanobacteriota bacterium]